MTRVLLSIRSRRGTFVLHWGPAALILWPDNGFIYRNHYSAWPTRGTPAEVEESALHVVMITNVVAPDKLGGLERYVRELAVALVRKGHEVTVIAKRIDPTHEVSEQLDDGVRILRYDMPNKNDPFFALKYPLATAMGVTKTLRSLGVASSSPMVIHGHFPVPMLSLALRRVPYVYTCHAPVYKELLDERQGSYKLPSLFQRLAVRALKGAEKFVIRGAAHVVTLSDFVGREVDELGGKAYAEIQRVPGGLDTEWFSPPEELTEAISEGKARGPRLFTARRLVARTGVESLIRAVGIMRLKEPDTRLVIAGDGPLRRRLEDIVQDLDLDPLVEFRGRVSEGELREQYRFADIAVTPTRNLEGFGLSTAEAMACGTVPFVTPVGANPEVVRGTAPELISEGIEPEQLASGLVNLWRSSEFKRIRDEVRSAVHPTLSWPVVADKYVSIYENFASHEAPIYPVRHYAK